MQLSDRIKLYENTYRQVFPPNSWIIIRLDGKGFHTWTRGLTQFNEGLSNTFISTAVSVVDSIFSNALLAYGQSDEVTIVLSPVYDPAQYMFGAKHDKLVSVSSSAFTAAFNSCKNEYADLRSKPPAIFDSRVFAVPSVDEVINTLLFRQQDAVRNSVQSLARTLASHKECHGLDSSGLQDLCHERGTNWNDLAPKWKRGWTLVKRQVTIDPAQYHGPIEYRPTEPYARKTWSLETPDILKERDALISNIKELLSPQS